MSENKKEGKFIVIEGLDRSGKTTQVDKLREKFPEALFIKFPDRTTEIGQFIDSVLSKKTVVHSDILNTLMTENRFENQEKIKNAIKSGRMVVCDRYFLSGITYGVFTGRNPMRALQSESELVNPDLTIFIDISDEIIEERNKEEELYEKANTQKEIKKLFHKHIKTLQSDASPYVTIDGNQTIEKIHGEIINIINNI